MIWFALVIPTICIIYTFLFHKKALKWWEPIILYTVAILVIGIAQFSMEGVQTTDTEYWGNFGTKAYYYEDWNEKVVYYETVTYSCGTT